MSTRSQKMAQEAYARIDERSKVNKDNYQKEYRSFAREFPTLVHQCGLAQAVAFAEAKKNHQLDYLDDLSKVLGKAGHTKAGSAKSLAELSRSEQVTGYIHLSRDALDAAVWLKRYVEAVFPENKETAQ